ncbi:MAG TPA: N-acetyl sugar amidotransferase, partial [Vicingus sp.]|nr:N-acetyl sugar amidotransferase [Vicingus sp.]
MDNISDPNISFDNEGFCSYCNEYFSTIETSSENNEAKKNKIENLIKKIKKEGTSKKYDCIVGVSGGLDSAYLVCKLVELGLKPIAVHFD